MNTDKLNSPQKITKLSLQLAPVRFQGKRPKPGVFSPIFDQLCL